MTWVKLDDHFDENDKQLRASDAAVRVWVCSMAWCARQKEPVGFMTKAQATMFVRGLGKKAAVIGELLDLNAWEEVGDGYLVHDFDVYLPKSSTARVRAWRAAKRAGQTPDPEPTDPNSRGALSNADVTRYNGVAQHDVTRAETESATRGNADATAGNSREWARSRGGTPVSRIPYTQSPPTSDSPPPPPQPGGGESGDMLADYRAWLVGLSQATSIEWREQQASRDEYRLRRAEGLSRDDLADAARGVALDKWFMGRNAEGVPHCNPTTVLKSPKLQTFIALARGQISRAGSQPMAAQFDALAEALDARRESPLRLVEGGQP
jgi:hypothetical protein